MNRDGSNLVNLTAGLAGEYFSGFTWTFDGKWVLFRGASQTFAANMSGRVITLQVPQLTPVTMVCSPDDSVIALIDKESYYKLWSARLAWTPDTLYVGGEPTILSGHWFGSYIDWVNYAGQ
jgi:hypothetical protein